MQAMDTTQIQAAVLTGRSGEFQPALAKGTQIRTALFTTRDRDQAHRYAELAAERNQHDDLDAIVWPELSIP